MSIVPDTKDWTWVLQRPCPQCGLDARAVAREQVATMTRDNAAAWRAVLDEPDVRRRPSPAVWSPLEYACHVRDVLRIFAERLRLMLTESGPVYPNWDQDEAAVAGRYGEQDPVLVGAELLGAAEVLTTRFESVSGRDWERTGHRSDGASFTIESFARYFIHDPVHHLYDVTGRRYDG